ncbi:putative Acyl-CoA dehydrogenase [Nitrospira sp. KM1]|uniref:acyl-CoA dehydrogenase family protein n=1 Tax=Nitrospira sp. KM1 TaxID=1936990 RepID=UPI0013A7B41E|nr:acyl-CoA dehydrogenase family protein [Nitrospira sp. KM1]BCA53331.1 putative Acyl-CoA dehydrogenase [Nitrospira sp. KM1]
MAGLFQGLEKIEEARERLAGRSFMTGLFSGRPDFSLLLAPDESPEEKTAWDMFRPRLQTFLTTQVDPDEIERTAKIPDSVIKGLFALGAFAMKIPQEYGGLGFSCTNYGRALMLIASWSNILSLTVAVPQSIGIAMPLLLFGSDQQRKKYLPIVAWHALSAFALTESMTGSDAANIVTEAVLDADGETFVVNGGKLWCTNGSIARYVTLIARVPAKRERRGGHMLWIPVPEGKGADQSVHTAFVLDMDAPGIRIRQRCQFEGCRGIENAYLTFADVPVPVGDLIGEVGWGLKYALTILNIGRAISIPAICLGMAKQAWQPTLDRANTRLTFQKPLAERQTQRIRLGRMASSLFAMEALASSVWRMADQHTFDIRTEAAIAKMFCSESAIRFLKDAQTLFGGMGYETADSKRMRGEPAFGIEQLVRDAEMYRIGEGATDILRPFVAREALNMHLEHAQKYFEDHMTGLRWVMAVGRLLGIYVPWYMKQWIPKPLPPHPEFRRPKVRHKLRFVERASRQLARATFYAMVWHREALRDDQGRQNRIENIGEGLFVIAATALAAQAEERRIGQTGVWDLADEVFRDTKVQVKEQISMLISNEDAQVTAVGTNALRGTYPMLSEGIIKRTLRDYKAPEEPAVGVAERRKRHVSH